jgi:hypothetical protein
VTHAGGLRRKHRRPISASEVSTSIKIDAKLRANFDEGSLLRAFKSCNATMQALFDIAAEGLPDT